MRMVVELSLGSADGVNCSLMRDEFEVEVLSGATDGALRLSSSRLRICTYRTRRIGRGCIIPTVFSHKQTECGAMPVAF